MDLGDLTQAGEKRVVGGVLHAAALDEEREVRVAIGVVHPAEAVAVVVELELTHGPEFVAEVFVELGENPFSAVIVHGVFEARVLAIGAVAEITLHQHHFFRDIDHLVHGAETDHIGEARIGLLVVVGGAHATADGDIETKEFAVLNDGDERKAVGEDVHVVGRRDGDGDLEFARQIGLAVDRLDLFLAGFDLFAIEPDLMIGAGLWREVIGNSLGHLEHLGVHF